MFGFRNYPTRGYCTLKATWERKGQTHAVGFTFHRRGRWLLVNDPGYVAVGPFACYWY